jgi:glycosyltransferase involved in cell wall biosynthesis
MKVCFVTTSFIRSADDHYARFVYEQAKSLRSADESTSVVVVAPHAPGLAAREYIDGLEIQRARYFWPNRLQRLAYQHEGLFETLRNSRLATVQLPLLLMALLFRLGRASKSAQIIHAQWVPTAAVALVVGWLRQIPVVVSVRGADLNTARNSRMGRMLTRAIISRVSYVVTVSDEFQDLLASDIGCPKPLAALYNGVDIEQFHPRDRAACRLELGLPKTQTIALYVGGLIERKGVKVLLQALAHRPVSDRPIDLYLAGEGPQLATLKAMASANGLTDRVHFLGSVAKDQMHLWMGAADVLVLPSYSEGRPNVVLEAMATGTPVVATSVNGTTELISDAEDGLLFKPGDVAGLADCLRRLLDQPDLAAKLSISGPEKIRRRGLSWLAHGRQLLSIYHQVLGGR